jgi:hypothetical protein
MERAGNIYNENLLGLVVSSAPEADYLVTIRHDEEGYVKDDDKIDAKELLEATQKGEPEYNEERKKRDFPPIHAEAEVRSLAPPARMGAPRLVRGREDGQLQYARFGASRVRFRQSPHRPKQAGALS